YVYMGRDGSKLTHFHPGPDPMYDDDKFMWRDELAKAAGYPKGKYKQHGMDWESHCVECWNGAQGPFSELINFSDCEGAIGTAVSAKLARDFAEFDAKAKDHSGDLGARFYQLYKEFRAVFEMAADSGAVYFH
ncbi:hypothetical protein QWC_31809, partial [Achromobacter marplatensis]